MRIRAIMAWLVALALVASWSADVSAQRPGRQAQQGQQQQRSGRFTWESTLQRYDGNNDGKVTRDEFKGPAQVFARLDENGDGTLTKEEFEKGMRGRDAAGGSGGDRAQQQPSQANNSRARSGRMVNFQEFPITKPAPGQQAPAFELRDLTGQVHSLAELLKTKPVVVEFGSFT